MSAFVLSEFQAERIQRAANGIKITQELLALLDKSGIELGADQREGVRDVLTTLSEAIVGPFEVAQSVAAPCSHPQA